MPELICPECGLRWLPRTERPKRCPRCGKKYAGPSIIGILLPYEADQFFQKIGFHYEYIFIDALSAHLETWQENVADPKLLAESCEILRLIGHPERIIRKEE